MDPELWNPSQKIIQHSNLTNLESLINSLANDNQKRMFIEGPFGKFAKIVGTTFPKSLVHLLHLHQSNKGKSNELCFKIGGKELVFTQYDFELMTGMKH